VDGPISRLDQIQDGGRPPFRKKKNRHNSAGISDIFTKFVVLVAMDSPQRPVMSFSATKKSKMAAGRHLVQKIQNGKIET